MRSNQNLRYFLGFSLLWWVAVVFVNPIGDFPLNDDWQYAYPVKTLIETGNYDLISVFSPNIFLQVIWGYLFCLPFCEFSFTTLRFSTLFLGWIGCLFFLQLLSRLSIKKDLVAWGTLMFCFNPLYFSLSFSFMTDVPFLVVMLLGVGSYFKYFATKQRIYRLLGILAGIAAFLIRQPGLLLIFSAELLLLLDKKSRTSILHFSGILLTLCLLHFSVEKGLKPWLDISENYLSVGSLYISDFLEKPQVFLFQFAKRTLMSIFYLGLFLLPFWNFIFKNCQKNGWLSWKHLTPIIVVNALIAGVLAHFEYIFPYGGNIFYNLGLGPILLADTWPEVVNSPKLLPDWSMILLGFICQIYGCYLLIWVSEKLFAVFKSSRKSPLKIEQKRWLFLVFLSAFYLGLVMVISYFDRYVLLPIACLIILIIADKSTIKKVDLIFKILVGVFAIFSLLATKNYLNWSRTAHLATHQLLEEKIPMKQIDADMAVNGFDNFPWLRNTRATFVLTTNPLPDLVVKDSLPYFNWLKMDTDYIYTSEKITD